ncbi:MAG: DUF4445 domain-containing protein [Rhodospirillales bacterium]|nr:DUF4445 domain-containing protein [Rhodospirillales bacterium]
MAKDFLIVFTPSGKRGRFAPGTLVLDAARDLGVDVDSVCGGRGICGRCQIDIGDGEFAKHGITSHPDHLNPITVEEIRFDKTKGLPGDRRLGCQARITGDIVIDVPPESQVHRQVVRKRAEARDITIDGNIHLHYLEVATSHMEGLIEALESQWGLSGIDIEAPAKATLADEFRASRNTFTVAIENEKTIIAAWPGYNGSIYGIAYDVGSTTIAAHLCSLTTGEVLASSGLMNPQIRFGEDLMSRVSYVMMNPGGEKELTSSVRAALNTLAQNVADEAKIETNKILAITIVGNPVMHHLVLGLDPTPLGVSPFKLSVDGALNILASDVELNINPGARAYIPPCIAGHVGADTAGVILSEAPYRSDEMTLIVDVGTNAEIVLGNKDKLLACSSPTGPAFEGAQISSGQRAAPGAIERVRIDPETLEPRFRVIGSDNWSNEEEFEDSIAKTGISGICGSGIIEAIAEMFLAGIVTTDGVINGQLGEKSTRIFSDGRTHSYLLHDGTPRIIVSQNDVRAIQLAKGALYAGARLLMDRLGIDSVERISLAGAFGSHIDVKYAMVLGLIPDCDLSKVVSVGNAAGTGARIALLNHPSRSEIEQVVDQVEKVETATEPAFQQHFIEAMAFPHKTADYPNLEKVLALPAKSTDSIKTRRRRQNRAHARNPL